MFNAPLTPEIMKAAMVIVVTVTAVIAVLCFWRERVLEKGEHRYAPMFAMGRMIFERLRNPEKLEARDSA